MSELLQIWFIVRFIIQFDNLNEFNDKIVH